MNPRSKPEPDLRTRTDQGRAADPAGSAWVSANAGSGKTHVLATRVIRILLSGTDPSRLLCLTYTRAAAAEMKGRVFDRLGAWVTMDDAALTEELQTIAGKAPDRSGRAFARTLFARALETPGGLKIQTIHAFCESLLHRFPLEANIAGRFTLMQPETQALVIAQARRRLIAGAGHRDAGTAGPALIRLLAETGESGLETLLDECVARRIEISDQLRRLATAEDRRRAYLRAFGFADSDDEATVQSTLWPLPGLTPQTLAELDADLPASGAKKARDFVVALRAAGGEPDPETRYTTLRSAFLTEAGEPRKTGQLISASVIAALGDFEERYNMALAHFCAIHERLLLWQEIDTTLDALMIADALIGGYESLKRSRGLLDFEDLIVRTANLLARAGASAWVRYKLDQGIDHILIDEAQDTSPVQWAVVRLLADEFFAGQSAREPNRTVFAVGDEKQSIYSFQGADPAGFAAARDHFATVIGQAEKTFAPVELTASFRSTQTVLEAIDHVFAVPETRAGLTTDDVPLAHRSLRTDRAGRVDVWERATAENEAAPEDWTAPVDATTPPALAVAERVARTIDQWLVEAPILPSTGRPVSAGDIVVLVRNRTDGFVPALSRALKDRNIAVAGADRLTMTDHIAVSDLMALGRVMLNGADDLSMAALLKSPLFGFNEDQLFKLAHGRGAITLWQRLVLAADEGDAACRSAAERLARWRSQALRMPVHEFYGSVLAADGGRAQLTGRLGPETGDVLNEFIALTLTFEETGPSMLETFIQTLEQHAPQIKREMDQGRGEVRIMTVHGAKGLEAPVVFLVDRGTAPADQRSAPLLTPVDGLDPIAASGPLLLWRGAKQTRSSVQAAAVEARRVAMLGEYRRLLYVGMTRAADWLIVCGYGGARRPADATWLDMVRQGLLPHSDAIETADGPVLRFGSPVPEPAKATHQETEPEAAPKPTIPDGFLEKAPVEPPLPRPLVPTGTSGLAIADPAGVGSAAARSLLAPAASSGTGPRRALLRGSAIHTLLQMLPSVPADQRRTRALAWCRQLEPGLGDETIGNWIDPVFAILDDPAFAPLFSGQSIAEVPVMGLVNVGGEERAISGVIDRLVAIDDAVLIIDYKTDRVPPAGPDEVSAAHLRQMALYRALVQPLYPHKTVKALLLFTAGPIVIEVPPPMLDDALDGLAQV